MSSIDPQIPPEEPSNPYAAPRAELEVPLFDVGDELAEAEAVRRAHLRHEASIKSLGTLHYFGAVFGLLGTISLTALVIQGGMELQPVLAAVIIVLYAGLAAMNLGLGMGLRSFRPWARWTEVAFCGIGVAFSLMAVFGSVLMGVFQATWVYAFGLLFQGWILSLLLSSKASVVFSERYRAIVERTPYIRYQTSMFVKIAVVALVAILVLSVISALVLGASSPRG